MTTTVLNVAEKPDAARTISTLLTRGQFHKREGFSPYNKIFEFDYFVPSLGSNCRMLFTSVLGHLFNYDFTGPYSKWEACNPRELFTAPVTKQCTHPDIERTLRREVMRCSVVVLWTDCDREGEHIAAEVAEVCREAKRNVRVMRARFSEITNRSIATALRSLTEVDQRAVDAVDARQILDLRIGAAFTRFQTLLLRRAYPNDFKQVISYGPCQFPTLNFVVERYNEIERFVAEPFWYLRAKLRDTDSNSDGTKKRKTSRATKPKRKRATRRRDDVFGDEGGAGAGSGAGSGSASDADSDGQDNNDITFRWMRGRLFDYDAVVAYYGSCQTRPPNASVRHVEQREKRKWRPEAMDTSRLERLAVTRLRMTAKQTMVIAERLYTRGLISYPRTETNSFPTGFEPQLLSAVREQTAHPDWGAFAQRVLDEFGGPRPRNGHKSDQAHPPIHPLRLAQAKDFRDPEEHRVYELIVRYFLACVSRDAIAMETKIEVQVGPASNVPSGSTQPYTAGDADAVDGEMFDTRGLIVLERNYLEVYPYEHWNDRELSREFRVGDRLNVNVEMLAGETEPPSLLTEADLISLMEKYEIGTDATHAEHIETIKARQYVGAVRVGGRDCLVPGELGMALIDAYSVRMLLNGLVKPSTRAELERDLKAVCNGTKTKQQVLDTYAQKYEQILNDAQQKVAMLRAAVEQFCGTNRTART